MWSGSWREWKGEGGKLCAIQPIPPAGESSAPAVGQKPSALVSPTAHSTSPAYSVEHTCSNEGRRRGEGGEQEGRGMGEGRRRKQGRGWEMEKEGRGMRMRGERNTKAEVKDHCTYNYISLSGPLCSVCTCTCIMPCMKE